LRIQACQIHRGLGASGANPKARVQAMALCAAAPSMSIGPWYDTPESAVRAWVRQTAIDGGRGVAGSLTTEEREELVRLRREVRTLRQERDILKKATAFFARESA
jgi:transposase-like protein